MAARASSGILHLALALTLLARSAAAEDAPPKPAPPPRREPLTLFAQVTVGFGKVRAVDTVVPTSLMTEPRPVLVDAQVGVTTFILGGQYDITKSIGAGLRFPFSFGNLGNITYEGGRQIAVGNFELYGVYQKQTSSTFGWLASFALALPSALGTEHPRAPQGLDAQASTYDLSDANKFSLNQAAAAAFGYEQNQLFWSKRFGLTPAFEAHTMIGKVQLAPFVKMVNLIDTHNPSVEPYRMELVFGGRAGYRVLPWLELALRAWGAVAPVRRGASPVGAGVLSPEVRAFFGERQAASIYIAGVLPFVGSNVDPYYFGALRAGLMGSF